MLVVLPHNFYPHCLRLEDNFRVSRNSVGLLEDNRSRIDSGYCGGYSSVSYPDIYKSPNSSIAGSTFAYYTKKNNDYQLQSDNEHRNKNLVYVEKPLPPPEPPSKTHFDNVGDKKQIGKKSGLLNAVNSGYYVKKIF